MSTSKIAQKEMEEFVKKCLTNRPWRANISKLSARAVQQIPKRKKFEKT